VTGGGNDDVSSGPLSLLGDVIVRSEHGFRKVGFLFCVYMCLWEREGRAFDEL